MSRNSIALILGSSPSAVQAGDWSLPGDVSIVAINNAWRIRADWDYLVHAGDFPVERRPREVGSNQQIYSYESYVPAQNEYGGFVYAGGTMAFTTGYWALAFLKPRVLAFFGCDMVYSAKTTHFYGQGAADPLRDDVTLRNLEAKSARLMILAARQGCACVNLSTESESRLVFPRIDLTELQDGLALKTTDMQSAEAALKEEARLNYIIEDGEYWHHMDEFDPDVLAQIDQLWLKAALLGEPT